MLFRSTGRLLWPDTETANMPMLSKMPHLKTPCLGGGCTYRGRVSTFCELALLCNIQKVYMCLSVKLWVMALQLKVACNSIWLAAAEQHTGDFWLSFEKCGTLYCTYDASGLQKGLHTTEAAVTMWMDSQA